jgi:predicted alpha/beta superfamily hydrolase
MSELSDTLRSTFRRAFRLENRRAAIRPGRLDKLSFESKILGTRRDATLYLPAGYDEREDTRFPVLYMHDGQNLFEPHRAFIPGQHWRLREAADQAIGELTAEAMIIVGIDNAGSSRIDEYTPTPDPKKRGGGKADNHGRMLIEELKPLIDGMYRTRSDSRNTGIGGSSLGGLVSLYLGLRRPNVFTRIAAMSPSVWWHERIIFTEVERFAEKTRPKIWLDTGLREGAEALRDVRALRDKLRERGWNNGDFRYVEDRRGDHSERAWARRAKAMLEFLFPPQPL